MVASMLGKARLAVEDRMSKLQETGCCHHYGFHTILSFIPHLVPAIYCSPVCVDSPAEDLFLTSLDNLAPTPEHNLKIHTLPTLAGTWFA